MAINDLNWIKQSALYHYYFYLEPGNIECDIDVSELRTWVYMYIHCTVYTASQSTCHSRGRL